MTTLETSSRPTWLDQQAYPFAANWLEVDGGAMHYVDEGQGQPLLFVHGTPTWSFLYREAIRTLRTEYRCIAPDNLGFGLSAKPVGWGYTPADHARNLALLIQRLDLRDIVLVVHDFGGPIGLSYALDHPKNIAGLVIMNTWMWDVRGENPASERLLRLMGGPLGRVLYERFNFSVQVLLPQLFAQRSLLTPALKRQYSGPFARAQDRHSTWVLARELLASGSWYESLWQRRSALSTIPTQLLWGMRDPAFGAAQLQRWQTALPQAEVEQLPQVGHFVPEEAPTQLAAAAQKVVGRARG